MRAPGLLALLTVFALVVTACGTPTPAVSTPTANPGRSLVLQKDLDLAAGEAVVTVRASAPGSDWAKSGAEAPTVSIWVDGTYRSDLVLFRGETAHAYESLVGAVTKGKHQVSVYLEPAKSAAGSKQVSVPELTVKVYEATDPLYVVMANAPILYGRTDSGTTDTPVMAYHETSPDGANTVVQYTVIYSHEDSGTAPDGLMARWGRLTDIEYYYRVTLDPAGQIVKAEYQDKDHNATAYKGAREGAHPVLAVVTRNGLFGEGTVSPFRFGLAPVQRLGDTAREEIMDQNPWTYLVMAQEWQRHAQTGTEKTPSPQTREVSDPINYLYVEFRSKPTPAGACDAKLAIQVKLRGNDTLYNSDHATDSLRIQSEGWRRSAIELPAGTTASQVEALTFTAYPGKNQPKCGIELIDLRKAFLLGTGYVPGRNLVTWQGSESLTPDATTGATASAVRRIPDR